MTTPDPTKVLASKDQWTQPLVAFSAYTMELSLPTKTDPPTTVGGPRADTASGKPKAHFSFSCGTCSALKPAAAVGWKRALLVGSGLQPFQRGLPSGLSRVIGAGQRLGMASALRDALSPKGRPAMNMASATSWLSLNPLALAAITPVVNASWIRSGDSSAIASRAGPRASRSSAALSWHTAHRASKTMKIPALAPVGASSTQRLGGACSWANAPGGTKNVPAISVSRHRASIATSAKRDFPDERCRVPLLTSPMAGSQHLTTDSRPSQGILCPIDD